MFIPSPFDQLHILFHNPQKFAQCAGIKTIALSQRNDRTDPIFCFSTRTENMNMHRFTWATFV